VKGHVRKRGATWTIVYDIGRDPETGRRRQRWQSGFGTKRDAERSLVDVLGRLDIGSYVEPTKQTVADFLRDEWLPTIAPQLKISTYASYRANLLNHVVPRIGGRRLRDLSPGLLNNLYAELLKEGRLDGQGGLSRKTVKYIHTTLQRALSDAVRWQKLARNPATDASPPKVEDTSMTRTVWSASQLRKFLESLAGDPIYAPCFLAAMTGMRRGEVLGLRWQDVDFPNETLSIQQSLISVEYQLQFTTPKTRRARRVVALDERTLAVLKGHRKAQIEEKLRFQTADQGHNLVFRTWDGEPIHPDAFSKAFNKRVAATQIPRIRFHDLRHTHATLLLQAGTNPKVVSERLGHSTVSITLDTYSHVIPSLQEDAAKRASELVFAELG